MKTQKYIVQLIAFNVFRLSLYGFATVIVLCILFVKPGGIKRAFIETNAYQRFVSLNIEAAVKSKQNNDSVTIKDPAVQQIIKNSFPPQKLQTETEKVIDSIYAWLDGRSAKPDFVADFTPNIEQMASDLSAYGINKLRLLPVCEIYLPTVDPFTSTCRPKYFDYTAEQKSLADAIRKNNGIIENIKYTVDDFPKTAEGRTLIEHYSYAPSVYKIMRYSPFMLFGVVTISAVLSIRLDRNKHNATRRVGISVIGATMFLILSPLFYFYILPYFLPSLGSNSSSGGGSVVFSDVTNKISADFNNHLIAIGLIILVVGLLIVLLERLTRPKSKYVRVNKKAGLLSSEASHKKQSKKQLNATNVPVQTSEGKQKSSRYQKNKRYRKISKEEL